MEPLPRRSVIQHLCRSLGTARDSGLADSALLERFLNVRDEAAFEVLVWRHSAVVMGVCHRLLRHTQDAEDAFQATFLTFARKAASIGNRESLSSWLYKVAYRCALAVRRRSPQQTQPLPTVEPVAPTSSPESGWSDLRPVIDEEVDNLPTRYRVPFVLCCVEGKTLEEAAQQLGHPKGTVSSWLCRGKDRLRDRLARRGVVLSVGALAGLIAQDLASASVPVLLVEKAVRVGLLGAAGPAAAGAIPVSVALLSREAIQTMFWSKIKVAVLASCAALALVGTVTAVTVARLPAPASAPTRAEVGSRREGPPALADKVPDGAVGFRGSVVGRLVSKDARRGDLVLEIISVQPAPGSKAKDPQSAIGKALAITGVRGKSLDTLGTIQEGEGARVSVTHPENGELQFIEELSKTAVPPKK